jgi:O-antigen ligase
MKDLNGLIRYSIYLVMIFYPATMFVVKNVRSEFFGVLVLLALISFLINKNKINFSSIFSNNYVPLFSFLLIFIIALISYMYFGFLEESKDRLSKYVLFIFAPFIFFLFRYSKPRVEVIVIGIMLGCYVAFGRALLEEFNLVDELAWKGHIGRANGSMHPIRFGNLSLLMGFICMAGAIYIKQNIVLRILLVFGFITGLGASILSGSRGGWIALPIMFIVILWPVFKWQNQKIKVLILAFILALLTSFISVPQFGVMKRIDQAASDIKLYFDQGKSGSAIGARFDMFETALHIYMQHPFFGVGIGEYHEYAKQYFDQHKKRMSGEVIKWKNPHNEFLVHATTRGTVGLFALLLMFFSSLYYFYRRRMDGDGIYRFSAISGMLIVIGYMHFGLSIALFEHRDFLVFFLVYMMFFLADSSTDRSFESG